VCDSELFNRPEPAAVVSTTSTTLQADEEDRALLTTTLKLPKNATLAEIEQSLRRRGFEIQIVPKALSGFLEIGTKPRKFSFSRSIRYKPRWFVLFPGSKFVSYFKSPHDVDCKPEKGRIFFHGSIHCPSPLEILINSRSELHKLRACSSEIADVWAKSLRQSIEG